MRNRSLQRFVIPATIVVMVAAFVEKASSLAMAATGSVEDAAPPAERCDRSSGGPAAATQAAAPIAPGAVDEAGLVAALQHRRSDLDRQARALDERAELVAAAEQKLQQKIDQLSALQARLQSADRERQQREAANWTGLVKTYEAMRPDDAAAIFNVLDADVLLEVLDRMDERKAAAILAAMLPERARQATQMLARKRVGDGATAAPASVIPVDAAGR